LQIWDQDNNPVQPGETGNVARLDANGYLDVARARRRHGDLAVNNYPAELENVIAAHPTSSRSRSSKAEASVTEKELVELCSVRLGAASRSIGQDAGRQDQAQGTS
jgi:hypothetical protein